MAVVFGLFACSETFQKCEHERKDRRGYKELNESSSRIIKGVVRLQLHASCALSDEGILGLLAAVAVAGFTFTLWRSTLGLVKAGEEALKTTERAFVVIDGFNYELTTAADTNIDVNGLPDYYVTRPNLFVTRFAVQPKWKNSGNTPTRNMRIQAGHGGPAANIPTDYYYGTDPSHLFVGPKAVEVTGFLEIGGSQALIDYGFRSDGGDEPMLFVWGMATYQDIFDKPHFIKWCYQARFDRHDGKNLRVSFIQSGDYNDTDED